MKYVNLEQRSDEWLAWRRNGITATESAVILGLSHYTTKRALWAEKTGRAQPKDLSRNPIVRYGVEHEPLARALFEEEHDVCVLPACGEMDEEPVFRASFDGLTPDGEPVEIKCPTDKILESVRTGGRESEAFRYYYVQVQHQIMVADAKRGFLVFFDHGRIHTFEIARDEELIARIREEGLKFHRAVLDDEWTSVDSAPEADPEKDGFIPAPEQMDEWVHAARRCTAVQAEIDELESRIARLKDSLKKDREVLISMMGEYNKADFGGVMLSKSCVRGKVDWTALFTEVVGRAPTETELELHRKPSTVRWTFSVTGRDLPERCTDERLAESVRSVPPEITWRL